jgi:hypothetical protein
MTDRRRSVDPDPTAVAWSDIPPDDPVVVAQAERALGPYRDVLPTEALEACEDMLIMMLTTHPEIAPMVERIRRAAPVQQSGTRAVAPPNGHGHAEAGGGRRPRGRR